MEISALNCCAQQFQSSSAQLGPARRCEKVARTGRREQDGGKVQRPGLNSSEPGRLCLVQVVFFDLREQFQIASQSTGSLWTDTPLIAPHVLTCRLESSSQQWNLVSHIISQSSRSSSSRCSQGCQKDAFFDVHSTGLPHLSRQKKTRNYLNLPDHLPDFHCCRVHREIYPVADPSNMSFGYSGWNSRKLQETRRHTHQPHFNILITCCTWRKSSLQCVRQRSWSQSRRGSNDKDCVHHEHTPACMGESCLMSVTHVTSCSCILSSDYTENPAGLSTGKDHTQEIFETDPLPPQVPEHVDHGSDLVPQVTGLTTIDSQCNLCASETTLIPTDNSLLPDDLAEYMYKTGNAFSRLQCIMSKWRCSQWRTSQSLGKQWVDSQCSWKAR